MKVALNYKDQLEFAISNSQDFSYEKEEMGLKGSSQSPQISIRDSSNKKFPMSEEFSMDSFETFLKEYLAGKLTPYLKSEQTPEENDGPVKVSNSYLIMLKWQKKWHVNF